MKPPLIFRPYGLHQQREHGVTMVLVAVAMVAIIAIAALSIDVITLYLAREEAQRSADAAALAAARILSVSGITGDPSNSSTLWTAVCGGTSSVASQSAQAVGMQNSVGGPAPTVTTAYSAGSGGTVSSNADCTQLASTTAFGVNPIVTVQVRQPSLPTFFSRVWGTTGNSVTATASAEAFNPSNSENVGNVVTGTPIPVQPRCVKPWAVPNQDPLHNNSGGFGPLGTCIGGSLGPNGCAKIVDLANGSIVKAGISVNGNGAGIIGETFWLNSDCQYASASCVLRRSTPQANYNNLVGYMKGPPNLIFAPGQVGTQVIAAPSCASGDDFTEAIAGCDSPANYTCGLPPGSGGTNVVDLRENPDSEIADGVSCLIHQGDLTTYTDTTGQDYLNHNLTSFGTPSDYPFQILAGSSSPLVAAGVGRGSPISISPSIVSLPIYDESTPVTAGTTTPVTFVGFLQVFINAVDQFGNVNVTVLNVAGCGNNATGSPVAGSSPVPVRLITPP
ncbi:MAG TPA: pilus assembly protein TadG-related protein [Candidatus Sulfotelmatobacter sp.]|nr:pilus assembly protein TadG-related protein [Candidatus Sulfotelmatobacter sp.]